MHKYIRHALYRYAIAFAFYVSLTSIIFADQFGGISNNAVGEGNPHNLGGTGCVQATTLLLRMDGGENKTAVTNLVCGMVADGTWPMFDVLNVWAINSTANALLNWVSSSFNSTAHGSGTFTANAGYTGDGSTFYLATGFDPSVGGFNATQNSTTIGFCDLSSRTTGNSSVGVGAGQTFMEVFNSTGSGDFVGEINDGGFDVTSPQASTLGSWMLSRTGANMKQPYFNGVNNGGNKSTSSAAITSDKFAFFAYSAVTPSNWTADQGAYGFVAGGFTSTQITAVYNRLHTYLGAVSAPAGC